MSKLFLKNIDNIYFKDYNNLEVKNFVIYFLIFEKYGK